MEKQKRNSSLELVKVIAIILIIFSSALPYGATYAGGGYDVYVNLNLTEFSFSHMLYTFFRWCGQIGDDLFIVCSAWFLCDSKKFKINKVLKMAGDSWILSIIGLVVALILGIPSITEILKSIFPITFQLNWFVGCYIIYYMLHPFINKALDGIQKKQFRILIVILFIAYSVIATISSGHYYSTSLVTFICIHTFVTYIKRYGIYEKISDKWNIIGTVICLALILVWIFAINLAGEYFEFASTKNLYLCGFANPIVIILALNVLCLAVKRNFYSKPINTIASQSLMIYLIHSNYFWLSYGKYWLYEKMYKITFLNSLPYVITVLLMTAIYLIALPILAILVDKTIGKFTAFIADKVCKKLQHLWSEPTLY